MNIRLFIILILFFANPTLVMSETLKIATDDDWFPNTYKSGNSAVGIQIDIVREALKSTKFNPEFIPCPWKRCLQHMRDGENDALVAASYTEERAEFTLHSRRRHC